MAEKFPTREGETLSAASSPKPEPYQADENQTQKELREEYYTSLNQWLNSYYNWQYATALFPYYLSQMAQMQAITAHQVSMNESSFSNISVGTEQQQAGRPQIRFRRVLPGFAVYINRRTEAERPPEETILRGRDCRIPSLWKRLVAECIDFFFLLVLKLAVTFVAIDYFDFINLEGYDVDWLSGETIDYDLAFALTSELIILELILRVFVTLIEAVCTYKGVQSRGGATPGKLMLRLQIVSCDHIQDLGNGRIRVSPAGDIGFAKAMVRSFVKNFSMAFLFPVFVTLITFRHKRTMYDIMSRTVVVEANDDFHHRWQ